MYISKEASWVSLNLRDLESSTGINAVCAVDTSSEGTLDATDGVGVLLVAYWVWEGDSWWAGLASCGFVDVGCADGWGLVVASEAIESDVEADGVGVLV